MPIEATNGLFAGVVKSVVAPAGRLPPISWSRAADGFSSKPSICPLRSKRKMPMPRASSAVDGWAAIVMSAPEATCAWTISSNSMR